MTERECVTVRISMALLEQLFKMCPHCGEMKPLMEFGLRRMQPADEELKPQSWCSSCR